MGDYGFGGGEADVELFGFAGPALAFASVMRASELSRTSWSRRCWRVDVQEWAPNAGFSELWGRSVPKASDLQLSETESVRDAAKCVFYARKDSSKALLLEAKDNLRRMLAAVPLTDVERAAIDDGQVALDRLLGQLADVPTPAGPTPRQISTPAQATLLPVIEINRRPT
ncbi:hypothetical protein [Nonomuraea lactucae]|uniref:hypothetical protein n=1 Tax=Nonomuraea lactucae TaxID=2249762 RepID=UPI0019666DF0|nr:hypothetical protein [Nonomuraea lactucae]